MPSAMKQRGLCWSVLALLVFSASLVVRPAIAAADPTPGSAWGYVVDSDDEPISGAIVEIFSTATGDFTELPNDAEPWFGCPVEPIATLTTGSDGYFEYPMDVGPSYTIRYSAAGYDYEYYGSGSPVFSTIWQAEVATIEDSEDTVDMSRMLVSPRPQVSGHVTDASGEPVVNGQVYLTPDGYYHSWSSARTDWDGGYRYVFATTGDTYTLWGDGMPLYTGEFYDDVYDSPLATPLALTESQPVVTADIVLERNRIVGTVTDDVTELPIEGAMVVLWAETAPESGAYEVIDSITTGEAGTFAFAPLNSDLRFKVSYSADGYATVFLDGAATEGESVGQYFFAVAVDEGQSLWTADLALAPSQTTVSTPSGSWWTSALLVALGLGLANRFARHIDAAKPQ